MVLLEAVCLFSGGYHCFLYGAAYDGGSAGCALLCIGIWDDHCDDRENTDLWRSNFGLAVTGVYYPSGQWRAAVLSWHSRAILIQDLYGSEEKTYISC